MGTPSFQANGPVSQSLNTTGSANAFSDPFITVFATRDPSNITDTQYPVKKRWLNTATTTEWILENFSTISGVTTANWVAINSTANAVLTLTGNTGGAVGPTSGNINVVGDGTTITIAGNPATHTLTASLVGGSSLLQTITGDDGVAVSPNMGTITLKGVVVNNGVNSQPIFTRHNGTSEEDIQVQLTTVTTSLGKNKNSAGLASFDSTIFSVDAATGWISLAGTGFVQSITGDDGVAVTPSGGTITLKGTVITQPNANGKAVFTKANGANEEDIQVQVSAAIAATDITKVGLAAFNNTQFTVDGNGFVTITGGAGPIEKFVMQTGTSPVVANGAAQVFVNGAFVAAGTNPVQSNGTGANTYQIQVQTSQAIATTNASNIGLAAFNNAQFSVDANGFVQMLHTPFSKINVQTFTSNGTYTPTTNMLFCVIEVVGGGGGGGGCVSNGPSAFSAAGGGGGGGYAKKVFTAAAIGASKPVTVGALGAGGLAGLNPGTAGGTSSVGALISATGGGGGGGSGTSGITLISGGIGSEGSGIGGDFNVNGSPGSPGIVINTGPTGGLPLGGAGGNSFYGIGGGVTGSGPGNTANSFGGGGAGASATAGGGPFAGGNGSSGIVIITEYIYG